MKNHSTIFTKLFLLPFLLSAAIAPLYAQTVIGGDTPDSSAMLDVQSNSKGVLFPRLTTAERDAINNPAAGLIIFNIETTCLEINLGATLAYWQPIKCAIGEVSSIDCSARIFNNFPLVPLTPATNQSISIPYSGGNGLSYEGQTVASTGVTGLTATLAAGNFANGDGTLTYTLSGTPSGYGTASFVISIGGQSCTLEVPMCGAYAAGSVWKVFLCYNLGAVGATSGANPMTPDWQLNGDYYQWGYQNKAAPGPSDASTPNSGNSSTFTAEYTWSTTNAPNGAWDDSTVPMSNNPCPKGFRVPSRTQWEEVVANNTISKSGSSWSSNANNYTAGKNIGSGLFLPAAGGRTSSSNASFDGILTNRNNTGYYWTSSPAISGVENALTLQFFENGNPYINFFYRTDGYAIRCVQD